MNPPHTPDPHAPSRSGAHLGDNVVAFPERTPVEEEAARWVVRLDEGRLSDAERTEFEVWRSLSPAHADAFNRMREAWRDLDALAAVSVGLPDAAPDPALGPARVRHVRPLMWGGLGLAAASLIAAVVVGFSMPSAPTGATLAQNAAAPAANLFRTELGGLENIALPDGSSVTLNTASQIEVRFDQAERSIRLLDGEAFFDVAHDAERPFRVYARDGVAAAVGTAFSVRLHPDSVEVIVSEGKVSFAEAEQANIPVAFIAAGQAASFNDRVNIIETVDLQEVERRLSWTEGRLVFAGEPLSRVVADISRYTNVNIVFADDEVANMPVGGYFDVGEVDRLLDALETSFALHVERVDDTHVRILGPLP